MLTVGWQKNGRRFLKKSRANKRKHTKDSPLESPTCDVGNVPSAERCNPSSPRVGLVIARKSNN